MVSVGYDPESQTLEIEFPAGRTYQYFEVPPSVHQWLMRASGKGGFFNRMIDGKFEFRRVDHLVPEDGPSLADALRASLSSAAPTSPPGDDDE